MVNRTIVERIAWRVAVWLVALATPVGASAQFDSGSNGEDRELTITTANCPVDGIWRPAGLDVDGDGIFEFTTISISGCTLNLRASVLGPRPVVWLAQGAVEILGTLDLSGENGVAGTTAVRRPAAPGPGGFAGGSGVGSIMSAPPTDGAGPGGGSAGSAYGGHGGHVAPGPFGHLVCPRPSCGPGGASYGTPYVLPLIGGSGGGGAGTEGSCTGSGGGGGGAILIVSTQSISIPAPGRISARGGSPNQEGSNCAGGGSGGAIRLIAPQITGNGSLNTAGGANAGGTTASIGRIRAEGNVVDSRFIVTGDYRAVGLSPQPFLFGEIDIPTVRVVSVNGQPVPPNPLGGFNPADVTVSTLVPVAVEIEAHGVPVGTVVNVDVHNETTGTATYASSPLTGSLESSAASAVVDLSAGFSLVTVRADFGS